MLARVRSAAVLGIDAYLVDVETDIANGLPTFATVGLPQGAVKEGRERVYAALANSGLPFSPVCHSESARRPTTCWRSRFPKNCKTMIIRVGWLLCRTAV